jgi:hypothetical protein
MHNKTLNALQSYELTVRQHENAAITYTVKWSPVLASGVTVSTSAWSTEDSNLTIAGAANTTVAASARLAATSPGIYKAVNKITDSDGNTDERAIRVVVKDNSKTYDYGM